MFTFTPPVLTGASCDRGHYRRMSDDIGWRLKMTAEVGQFDPETELIEVSVDLFIASMASEEGKERAYLDHLRRAQAHLTGLILDAEKQGPPASRSLPMGRPPGWANATSSPRPSLCRLPLGPPLVRSNYHVQQIVGTKWGLHLEFPVRA